MREEDVGFLIIVIIIMVLVSCFCGAMGLKSGRQEIQNQAIIHNAAYYNPTNAQFTWK